MSDKLFPPADMEKPSPRLKWLKANNLALGELPVEGDGWVLSNDRWPKGEEYPIITHFTDGQDEIWYQEKATARPFYWKLYREEYPAPEPNAMTMEEDHKAFSEQYAKLRTGDNYRTMWDAALHYERSVIRALVDRYNESEMKPHEFIHAVAERTK